MIYDILYDVLKIRISMRSISDYLLLLNHCRYRSILSIHLIVIWFGNIYILTWYILYLRVRDEEFMDGLLHFDI